MHYELTLSGLGFYWARQCGMFNAQKNPRLVPPLDAADAEKMEAWKSWAAFEVQDRAVLGHYLLDGHISQFSGYEACARHMTNPLHMPASDSAFEASTADEWILKMQQREGGNRSFRELFVQLFSITWHDQPPQLSSFTLRILLEGLQSLVAEVHQSHGQRAVGTPSKADIARALIQLHKTYLHDSAAASVEQTELLIRWHSICLELTVPSTSLCRRMCAVHGISQTLHDTSNLESDDFDFKEWSQSPDCLRAVLHCIAILEIVEKLPLGRSHAIHLPAAVFAVSTVYSARCLSGFSTIITPRTFSWENVWKVGPESNDPSTIDSDVDIYLAGKLSKAGSNSYTKNLMYELNSLHIILLAVSPRWGVSYEMDTILSRWMAIVNEQNTCNAV